MWRALATQAGAPASGAGFWSLLAAAPGLSAHPAWLALLRASTEYYVGLDARALGHVLDQPGLPAAQHRLVLQDVARRGPPAVRAVVPLLSSAAWARVPTAERARWLATADRATRLAVVRHLGAGSVHDAERDTQAPGPALADGPSPVR